MNTAVHGQITEPHDGIEKFRQLLHDLAARLICARPCGVGSEIDHTIEATARFWNLDWLCFFELSPDQKRVHSIHSYTAQESISPSVRIINNHLPRFMEKMSNCNPAVFDQIPGPFCNDDCARYRNEEKPATPVLIIPADSDESIEGILMFPSLPVQHWCANGLLEEFRYLGRILAGSLERKKAVEDIGELRQFEKLLSEISATYINLPVEEIEKTVKYDFGRLGKLLQADRFNLYLISEDRVSFNLEEHFAWWPDEDDILIKKIEKEDIKTRALFDKSHYLFDKWRKGEVCQFERLEDLPDDASEVKGILAKFGAKSYLSIPITLAGSPAGAFTVVTTHHHRTWSNDLLPRLRLFGEIFINAMERKISEEKLREALSEVRILKDRIEADYVYLREEIKLEYDIRDIVGRSDALKGILLKIRQVAPTNATVLILGETGTGKGLIARAVHNASVRKDRPLIQVNCAALAPSLIESELFGHEKGAFTGAQACKIGRFELANGTTLFLDEIGDLPLEMQAKLLRVLQDGEFERVGGTTTIKTDARIIAATNKDLEKEADEGRFRKDLWYRLNVFPINVPPLRERLQDIPLFISFFLDRYGKWIGKRFDKVHQGTIKALQRYSWPGNIRELENLIERSVITSSDGKLQIDAPKEREGKLHKNGTIEEIERSYILEVLNDTYWKINGANGAAKRLGMNPSTLRFRMKHLGISRPVASLR